MKRYHILFKDDNSTPYAKGVNIEAEDEHSALARFKEEFPNAQFLYMASEEMFDWKYVRAQIS